MKQYSVIKLLIVGTIITFINLCFAFSSVGMYFNISALLFCFFISTLIIKSLTV